jgi:hypothetical protein
MENARIVAVFMPMKIGLTSEETCTAMRILKQSFQDPQIPLEVHSFVRVDFAGATACLYRK